MLNLGFLASHGGSSMRAIIAAIRRGELAAEARLVIANNADAPALSHAREAGVRALHLSQSKLGREGDVDRAIADALAEAGVDLAVLTVPRQLILGVVDDPFGRQDDGHNRAFSDPALQRDLATV